MPTGSMTESLNAASTARRFPIKLVLARFLSRVDGWTLGILLLAALFTSPIFAVLGIALESSGDAWAHLASTVLGTYISQTFGLIVGVGAGVLVIGVSTAWLVTMFDFPGRRVLQWALLLPLAMPAYIAAYTYTDVLEFAGPVQTALRQLFGWQSPRDYWFPEIRSLGGAVTFMSLVLYPYVYLLARSAFVEQSQNLWDAARGLGRGTWSCFAKVGLPLARPAIAVGVLLALMETLNDFGTVDYFAVQTLTVGVYRVWFGMNNAPAAAQLATMVLALVLVMAALERTARGRRRYQFSHSVPRRNPLARLDGIRGTLALLACATPVALGFAIPAVLMAASAVGSTETAVGVSTLGLAVNSVAVAGVAALVCLCAGLFLAYGARLSGTPLVKTATRVASIGYTIPGVVLAVGVLIPAAALDNTIDAFMTNLFQRPNRAAVQRHALRADLRLHGSFPGPVLRLPGGRPDQDHPQHGRRSPFPGTPSGRGAGPCPSSPVAEQRPDGRHAGLRGRHEGAPDDPDPASLQLQHARNPRLRIRLLRGLRAGRAGRSRHRGRGSGPRDLPQPELQGLGQVFIRTNTSCHLA